MKTPRITSASTMPISSTFCWYGRGTREPGHDDHEDEQVVDGQAVLGEPAGGELRRRKSAAGEEPDPERRTARPAHVEGDPDRRLAHRRLVRPSTDDRAGRRPVFPSSRSEWRSRPNRARSSFSYLRRHVTTRGYGGTAGAPARSHSVYAEVSPADSCLTTSGPGCTRLIPAGLTRAHRADDAAAREYSPPCCIPILHDAAPGCEGAPRRSSSHAPWSDQDARTVVWRAGAAAAAAAAANEDCVCRPNLKADSRSGRKAAIFASEVGAGVGAAAVEPRGAALRVAPGRAGTRTQRARKERVRHVGCRAWFWR